MLKKLSSTILVALLLASPAFAKEKLTIAVNVPTTGDFAAYGIPTVNAAKAVAANVNKDGGVLGMELEIIALDDQCKPELAVNVANKAISENVKAVIGHICSGATRAALPIYKEINLPVISSATTSPELTQSGEYPVFFRTIASDDLQALTGVNLAIDTLGAKKIAIVHDKGDYGKGYATFAKQIIEEGKKAEVVLFEGITVGAIDYSAIIQKIRASKADAVIFGGYHPEASKLSQQMRKKKIAIPFIGSDSIMSAEFVELAGNNISEVYATSGKDLSNVKEYNDAVAQHKELYGEKVGLFYMEAYAAAQALVNAFKAVGSTDSIKVMNALRSEFVNTPLGRIRFDAKGDAEGVGFGVYKVVNGKYELLK